MAPVVTSRRESIGCVNPSAAIGQQVAMPKSDTDASLVVGSRIDPARFGEIFDRHFGAIHRYLGRRVGGQLADELAAETFLEAFRTRGRYDESYPDARPWLYGIAANLLRHHRREERRRLMAYQRTGVDRWADPSEESDRRVDAAASGPAIARALVSLRTGDRDVLLLFAWGELTYEEIARALGIPIGTVRSRLNRARRRVRELVGDIGQYLTEDDVVPQSKGGTTHG